MKLRPPTLDDVPALLVFYLELHERYGSGSPNEGEIRDWLASPLLEPKKDMRIGLADGSIVGWVDVFDQNKAHERLFVDCRAKLQDRNIYVPLLDWVEGRAREIASGGSAVLRAGADAGDEVLANELGRRGYLFTRHFFRMEIELTNDLPQPEWPEGITVRTFGDGDAQAVYNADNEAFADHWDFVPWRFEEWGEFLLRSSNFDPSLWFLAEEAGELAGISLCFSERRPNVGHVGILGVRPRWRRRGLGTALLRHSFGELRQRGRPKADLGVDGENTTGAVRLYERAGMHVAHRTDAYEKALP